MKIIDETLMRRNTFLKTGYALCFCSIVIFIVFAGVKIRAQEVVDKTVASISDGSNTELITYSDLLWQLTLQPEVSLEPPTSGDLNRILEVLINQRLFALEARRIPNAEPEESEIKAEIARILALFPSTAEFERRLRLVGFNSINDDNFQRIMRQRVAIEKYLDFRFRSFIVITPDDEEKYYKDVYTPEFRKTYPGLLLPPLDDKRSDINKTLTERKIEENIEKFLDDAKKRNQVVILSEV